MIIPIDQFEQFIDETILKRGLQYFKNGQVHEPEEILPGEYEALVEGTEEYLVQLSIKNGFVTEYVCNCPYDMGPVCKHVAAVIFYLQQEKLNLVIKPKKSRSSPQSKPPKRRKVASQIDQILERTTHDDLKQFLREKAAENLPFRNLILSSFAQHHAEESKAFYTKQLKSIVKAGRDRHGFIHLSAARYVGTAADRLLESALAQMQQGNYKSAFFISIAVMEEFTEVLQYSDDSNGDIGGSIDSAYGLLYSIAQEQLTVEIRKLLFDYCCSAFDKGVYADWDWHIGVLRIAAHLAENEKEIERVAKQINAMQSPGYSRDEVQGIMYHLLLHKVSEADADKYLEKNITNYKLRNIAIQRAVEKGQLDRAISIANDGIEFDFRARPGRLDDWFQWLLKIYQTKKDSDRVIEYARILFIRNMRDGKAYYPILKEHVSSGQWETFVGKMINDIKKERSLFSWDLMAFIFIEEKWWDRLLEMLKESGDLSLIELYQKDLAKPYAKELVDLYAVGVVNYLADNTGRGHYQRMCRYLRKMIKLGGREKANEVISFLRKEYPTRRALLEELDRV